MSMKERRERLLELLTLDEQTGNLYWRLRFNGRIKLERPAGYMQERGYIVIRFEGYNFYAHHIVWAKVHGFWTKYLDHKDRNGANNRPNNLRKASYRENALNSARNEKSVTGSVRRTGILKEVVEWLS